MKLLKFRLNPYISLSVNFAYAICSCIIGFISHSWWFITVGAYYTVLATTRFCVLQCGKRANESKNIERFTKRFTGVMLIILSYCLIGVNILSALKERGTVFNEIVMIAIAVYTFSKITVAITGLVKAKRNSSETVKILRNISLADAFVSVYTLQRSMLISFPGMKPEQIRLFNILTGTAVWIVLLLLGINLIGGRHIDMAKSKIVKANEKIAEAVTGGYKKIENCVVNSYAKIEDKFVDAYRTKDGETVEEAKKRLKKENK